MRGRPAHVATAAKVIATGTVRVRVLVAAGERAAERVSVPDVRALAGAAAYEGTRAPATGEIGLPVPSVRVTARAVQPGEPQRLNVCASVRVAAPDEVAPSERRSRSAIRPSGTPACQRESIWQTFPVV